MINWQVELLRLTIFRATPTDQVVPLWENLTGEKPVKVDSQPRTNIIHEEGPYMDGTLIHVSNPIRIDWFLTPGEEQMRESAFPILGPFAEIKDNFIQLMSKWLISEMVPDTKRMALGNTILLPLNSKELAYKQLSSLLSRVDLDVKNSTDFLYQINRPMKSRSNIPALEINRLSKWSAARIVGMGLFFDAKPEVITDTPKEYFACRLELDINTTQNRDQKFSKDETIMILKELSDLTDEIAEKGDI